MQKQRRLFLKYIGATLCLPLLSRAVAAKVESPLLRVAVISDLNHSYGTIGYDPPVKAAIKRLLELKPDIVLCTGDMIAGQRLAPKLSRKKLEAMWQGFHGTISRPLREAGIIFPFCKGALIPLTTLSPLTGYCLLLLTQQLRDVCHRRRCSG